MSELLRVEKLNKFYGKKQALCDVSFELPKGQMIGLLGPNGSGKTTMIKIINTLITDYTGSILVCGNKPGVISKQLISYLPDRSYLSPWMRVRTCIGIFKEFYSDFDENKALELCDTLKLEQNMRISAMSKGMLEKLQLVLVISRKAKLYIFDEPLAGVDPAARELIINTILTNFNEEGSVLISTHLISDVEKILDHALFLKDGKIVLDESVDSARERTGMTLDELFREMFRF